MFTGLIEEKGYIKKINSGAEGAELIIGARKVLSGLKTGDSVAVSGPCLTATTVGKDSFTAWAMPETMKRSNLGLLKVGQPVNLERALALGDRLGGHLVSGHVDSLVTLSGRREQGGAFILSFALPEHLARYIVAKGSVALDGVSLTVIEAENNYFSVGLIPITAAETTLGQKEIGASLNLEVDMIGKYVEKMLIPHLRGEDDREETITLSFLQKQGYL